MATTLTQYGTTITWTEDREIGQYVTGDWWIIGPITITSKTPASVVVQQNNTSGVLVSRTMHGAMLNPVPNQFASHGFDSSTSLYNASLNVARPGGNDLSVGNPLVVAAGNSLVCAVSHPNFDNRPGFTDQTVFTVVSTAPATGSFRPAYVAGDKSVPANESDIDYNQLQNLAVPADAVGSSAPPLLTNTAITFERPWIDFITNYNGREIHALNNWKGNHYGRDAAFAIASAILRLNLSATNAEKRATLIGILQYGLDTWSIVRTGAIFEANGGHQLGRKLPLLLAGHVLNKSDIMVYGNGAVNRVFQEDRQHFIVSEAEVAITNDLRALPSITSTSVSAAVVTATCATAHNLPLPRFATTQSMIRVSGFSPADINGDWIGNRTNDTQFTFRLSANASGPVTTTGTISHIFKWTPNIVNGTPIAYTSADLGLNEWGIEAAANPGANNKLWATNYRHVCGPPNIGTILCAHIMGLVDDWNWQVTFDYVDRFWNIEKNGTSIPGFYKSMWNAYRGGVTAVAPSITQQPTGVSVIEGTPVSFFVAASGTNPITYQWRKNGVNISGATSQTLNFLTTTLSDSGTYSCVATNSEGSATSVGAFLSVTPDTPPPVTNSYWPRKRRNFTIQN